MEPTRGERPPHASFIRAHAESVPPTRASFAHTRRESPARELPSRTLRDRSSPPSSVRARELYSRTRGECPPHASFIRAHAESVPRTRAPFTHTRRASPARELHSRTREGPPRFKGYSEFVISIHFCYLGRENHLPRPSYPSSGRENHLPRPSPPLLDAKSIFRVQVIPLLDARATFGVHTNGLKEN